jgi:hypothetical protein
VRVSRNEKRGTGTAGAGERGQREGHTSTSGVESSVGGGRGREEEGEFAVLRSERIPEADGACYFPWQFSSATVAGAAFGFPLEEGGCVSTVTTWGTGTGSLWSI